MTRTRRPLVWHEPTGANVPMPAEQLTAEGWRQLTDGRWAR